MVGRSIDQSIDRSRSVNQSVGVSSILTGDPRRNYEKLLGCLAFAVSQKDAAELRRVLAKITKAPSGGLDEKAMEIVDQAKVMERQLVLEDQA